MSANLGPIRNSWNPRILQQSIISFENTVNYKHVDFIAFAVLALKQHVSAQRFPVISNSAVAEAPPGLFIPPERQVVTRADIRGAGRQDLHLNNTALKSIRDSHESPKGVPTV